MKTMKAFTLIETLVAIVIVAVGIGALYATINPMIHHQSILENKIKALWVAQNIVSKIYLNQIPEVYKNNQYKSELTMSNQQFSYQIEKQTTEFEKMVKYNVKVSLLSDGTTVQLTAFGDVNP